MNPKLKELQQFLKASPLGISYPKEVSGELNPETTAAAMSLQNKIKQILSNHPDNTVKERAAKLNILQGQNPGTSVNEIKKLILEISKPKQPVKPEEHTTNPEDVKNTKDVKNPEAVKNTKSDFNIKSVQETFNSNPFGIKYQGPKDGVMNDELTAKLRQLETNISTLSGAPVIGKIIAGDKLATSPGDLTRTFKLINEYKKFLDKTVEIKKK